MRFIFSLWISNCFYSFSIELLLHICQKNQLVIFVWVYFWSLYPVILICESISLLVPHCRDCVAL